MIVEKRRRENVRQVPVRWSSGKQIRVIGVGVADVVYPVARDKVTVLHGSQHIERFQERIVELGEESRARLTVMLVDGTVMADSHSDPRAMGDHSSRPEIVDALEAGEGHSSRFSRTMGQRMRYLALPLRQVDRPDAVVRVSVPLDVIGEAIASIELPDFVEGYEKGRSRARARARKE